MKKRITILSAVALLTFIFGSLAFSQSGPFLIKKEQVNGITVISGGVGQDERDYMQDMADQFSTKIILSLKSGNYLARVPVTIKDSGGEKVLEMETNGPWLYAELPQGRYTVTASYEGEAMEKQVNVPQSGQATVYLQWED
jgi:hypothetical protein